ncbi:MAG TPA: Rrf2 family transcriptional regulator, partial [Flavobacteriaceae bacterium]|nr:Rrf2 family transcriptional regulator [Flavobacteriaceae bacterium]
MISNKTKYGLKALAYLARQDNNQPVQIGVISKSENISQKFLESILLTLRKNGFLGSKKGKGGGYYLLKEPKDIKMSAVMRILEGPIALVPCVSLNFYE